HRRIAKQILQSVRKSFDLIEAAARYRSAGADDRIARTGHDVGSCVDRTRTVFELSDKAIMHASKGLRLGFAQIQSGEKAPKSDRKIAYHWLLDLAEPTHELGQQLTGYPVGQEKIYVLLLKDAQNLRSKCHAGVKSLGYGLIRWNGTAQRWHSTGSAPRRWRPRSSPCAGGCSFRRPSTHR